MSTRRYLETHPWLTFKLNLTDLSYRTWMLLGEAASKCEHVAGVPLKPAVATELMRVYLSKGAHGTTSIEGNTLSEQEVRQKVDGDLHLSRSRSYLGDEIANIVNAYNGIVQDVFNGVYDPVDEDLLKYYHKQILSDQPLKGGVELGEFRTHSVGVNDYKAPPWQDSSYLVERLCDWLQTGFEAPADRPELIMPLRFLKAIMAHLYVAWIHPFGDGNGRVARMVEFQLLVEAGLPLPACHVLSDHYNRTRDGYYAALSSTSKREGYPVEVFLQYAMQGFVDELREQIGTIREHQMEVTWENHVHGVYRDRDTPACRRQKHIALDLPQNEWVSRSKLRVLSARVAEEYVGKTSKTVTRDLNALRDQGLVLLMGNRVLANREVIQAFLPARAETPSEENEALAL